MTVVVCIVVRFMFMSCSVMVSGLALTFDVYLVLFLESGSGVFVYFCVMRVVIFV